TFANPDDYERIQAEDTIDIVGLADLAPGRPVDVVIHHANGSSDTITTTHTMSDEHIAWFRGGSALNVLRGNCPRRASPLLPTCVGKPELFGSGDAGTEAGELQLSGLGAAEPALGEARTAGGDRREIDGGCADGVTHAGV